MSNQPLVSIALPVFNGGKTLAVAIRSILDQSYKKWNLIIVDDGSQDDSLTIARSFKDPRIQIVLDGNHEGISSRLNQAVALAQGKYLARMDSDDVAFPGRLEAQVHYLESNPGIDLLGTGRLIYSGDGILQGVVPIYRTHEEITSKPWSGFHLAHSSWMGKRDWFLTWKYRSTANGAEDQDLLFRAYQNSQFACLTEILLGYKEDPRSVGKMFKARTVFFRVIFPEAIRKRDYGSATLIAFSQLAKILGDILNIKLGVKFLRNKMVPADTRLTEDWGRLWNKLRS